MTLSLAVHGTATVNPEVNIIVCVDPRVCGHPAFPGVNGYELLDGLDETVREQDLGERVRVTECQCIFGCTFGPRADVIRRWDGEKLLYGSVSGTVTISVRGRVDMNAIPGDLADMLRDNLPAD